MEDQITSYGVGFRLLMATLRNKDGGPSTKPDRSARKRIVMEGESTHLAVDEMLKEMERGERLYMSVNERDFDKAVREFKRQQLDADYADIDQRRRFYVDIKNKFYSCMAKPQSKAESYFIIDIDGEKELDEFDKTYRHLTKPIQETDRYETKNGWHIVTEPFNPQILEGRFDIKKDGMLLLAW